MTDMPPAVSNVQNGVNSILSVAYHLGGAPALQPLANAYLASVATCIEMYLGKDQAIASLLSMVQVLEARPATSEESKPTGPFTPKVVAGTDTATGPGA